jgi:predicted Zn-dependent protease
LHLFEKQLFFSENVLKLKLLAFVVANNFNFKTFSEKKSCFSNKCNEKISTEQFNLIDDPHIPEGIGTKPIDDEGIETKKNNIIEKGIFKNTYSDLFDGYKKNGESTGNASRSGSPMGRSSEPIPISSPHNLKISQGRISQEDMIKESNTRVTNRKTMVHVCSESNQRGFFMYCKKRNTNYQRWKSNRTRKISKNYS